MSLSNLLIIFSSSFMALFPVINPLGNGFVVNGFFTDLDPQQRKAAIQKLTLNFIMIGVGTLVIGHLFLLIFGLAIPVIQLGGGMLEFVKRTRSCWAIRVRLINEEAVRM